VPALAFVAWIVVRVRMKPSLAPNAPLVAYPGFARFKPFLLYVLPLVSIFAVVVGAMAAAGERRPSRPPSARSRRSSSRWPTARSRGRSCSRR
jgi:hypothetical protein